MSAPATRGTDRNQRTAKLWDIQEVADRLGVQVRHVRRLVNERRIPFIKWGHLLRFDPQEIEVWLDGARDVRHEGEQEGSNPPDVAADALRRRTGRAPRGALSTGLRRSPSCLRQTSKMRRRPRRLCIQLEQAVTELDRARLAAEVRDVARAIVAEGSEGPTEAA